MKNKVRFCLTVHQECRFLWYPKMLFLTLSYHVQFIWLYLNDLLCFNDASFFGFSDKLSSDELNMELVVQCIRTSKNPQTHQQALLLLRTTAKMFPVSLTESLQSNCEMFGKRCLIHMCCAYFLGASTPYQKRCS